MSDNKKRELHYPSVLFYIHLHFLSIYAIYLIFFEAKLLTVLLFVLLILFGTFGATAGAHRLWAHHSYDADKKLKVVLMLLHTLSGQGTIYNWVVKHRLHHKYLDTENDPYNSSKGFLFSHLISNIVTKLPKDTELCKEIDTKDLDNDSVIMFQKRFFWPLVTVLCFLLPMNAPIEYWHESIINSTLIIGILRYTIICHITWLINSASLIWGLGSSDKHPTDTNMVFLVTKSYWPQYHYFLPWDYQTGEFGTYGTDCTSKFIRVMAAVGLASNLRTIDSDGVKRALAKCIDSGHSIEDCLKDEATALLNLNSYSYTQKSI